MQENPSKKRCKGLYKITVRFLIQFHGEILTTAKTCVISEVAVHIFLKQLFIEVEVIAVDI